MIILGNSANKSQAFSAVTCAYTTTAIDQNISISGTSGTVTIHTAVGNKGQVLTLIHAGTSLTQIYTLNSTGGQSIGGLISGAYALATNGETIQLISDNSAWIQLDHLASTGETSAGTIGITGTSVNPTKGTTTTVDRVIWSRRGKFARIYYEYSQSNTGTAGTGDYLFALPANITADTTLLTLSTTTASLSARQFPTQGVFVSNAAGGGGQAQLWPAMYDSTHFRLVGAIGTTLVVFASGTTNGNLSVANLSIGGWIEIPISGWQP